MSGFTRRLQRTVAVDLGVAASAITQQQTGTWSGTTTTVSLPAASAGTSIVLLFVAANTTVTTPSGWTLRTSQVNFMGHYLFTRTGGGASSWNLTSAVGDGTWYACEVSYATYESAQSSNNPAADLTYSTPSITPSAGSRMLLASIGSTTSGAVVRTVSGWTNSFVERADICQSASDYPMQGIASAEVTASGITAFSTTTTYSTSSVGRSALMCSLVTTGGVPDTQPPTVPIGLTSSGVGSSWIGLAWNASTDNVTVDHYDVYRDTVLITSVSATSYVDNGLAASTSYDYTVRAVDAAGNASAQSTTLSVSTTAGGGGGGWPDSTNTGYRNAPGYPGSLTNGTGMTIQSNQTYNFYSFNGCDVGNSSTAVSNVTFNGCRFYGPSVEGALVLLFGDNVTFNYCSFEPGVATPPVAYSQSYQYGLAGAGSYNTHIEKLTVSHCDFWGFGNAIDINGSTQAKPHVFEHNWIHDAADDGGSYHTDGIGNTTGAGIGSYVVIHHNTIESVGNTNGIAYQQGTYDHMTITDNWFGGFGYTIAVWANTSTTFTGNVFSTRLPVTFGPLYPQTFWTGGASLWRNNIWRVPVGAAWGNPAHDGWYWIPNPTASTNDSNFTSQTDYTG